MEKGKVIRKLVAGDYFGEKSVLLDTKRSKDIVALTDCQIYSIPIDTIKNVIGPTFREILYTNLVKMAMCDSHVFKKFNLKLLDNALTLFRIRHYSKGQTVVPQGHDPTSLILIIIQGQLVDVSSNLKIIIII